MAIGRADGTSTWSGIGRRARPLALHAAAWGVSFASAAVLWPGALPEGSWLPGTALLFLSLKGAVFAAARGFVDPRDEGALVHLLAVVAIAAGLLGVALGLLGPALPSSSFAFFDGALAVALLLGARDGRRWIGWLSARARPRGTVLLGRPELLDRFLSASPPGARRPIGALVDGRLEPGARLGRLPVFDDMRFDRLLSTGRVDAVVALPPISPALAAWVEGRCRAAGVPVRWDHELEARGRLPGALSLDELSELIGPPRRPGDDARRGRSGEQPRTTLRLLGALRGRRVLITGAASWLGSALARELLRLGPRAITLADRDDVALARLERELRRASSLGPIDVSSWLLDGRYAGALRRLLRERAPEVVFHCAGYTDPAAAERRPSETVLENLFATRALARAADEHCVARFILASSVQAARPTSALGAVEWLRVRCLLGFAAESPTRFAAVRLPEIPEAPGGAVDRLADELECGLPLTVADLDKECLFLSTAEACRCLLEAAALVESGEVFVPDGARPARLAAIAERLIARAGRRGRAAIAFVGLAPGEKLADELALPEERLLPSAAPGLQVVHGPALPLAPLETGLDRLAEAALAGDDREVSLRLAELVPGYRPAPAAADEPWPELDGLIAEDDEVTTMRNPHPTAATPLAVVRGAGR